MRRAYRKVARLPREQEALAAPSDPRRLALDTRSLVIALGSAYIFRKRKADSGL
jgi:hypothetical protein